MISARPLTSQLACSLVLLYVLQHTVAVIHTNPKQGLIYPYQQPVQTDLKLNKVSLTQRGYIQFLRYFNNVPTLTEYTFCIWVRSSNLTYSHPLLSYSKDEEQRLIRVWITPHGTHINLEILQIPVFSIPVGFVENRWYHVCQSWSSFGGAWNLFLNGRLFAGGFEPKLKAIIIPSGGDLIVGQEYTDFDKGLDDGIEGDIFGFNFVLSFAATLLSEPPLPYYPPHNLLKRSYDEDGTKTKRVVFPDSAGSSSEPEEYSENDEDFLFTSSEEKERRPAYSYVMSESNKQPKTFTSIFHDIVQLFEPEVTLKTKQVHHPEPQPQDSISRVINNVHGAHKPLGLLLVELSFHCGVKRGAPLSGRDVLINWNLTPVRVFGGAIMKTVPAFC